MVQTKLLKKDVNFTVPLLSIYLEQFSHGRHYIRFLRLYRFRDSDVKGQINASYFANIFDHPRHKKVVFGFVAHIMLSTNSIDAEFLIIHLILLSVISKFRC